MNKMDSDARQAKPDRESAPGFTKENLYDKIPLSKKQLDVISVVLIAATAAAFILGALSGNGII